MPTPRKGNALGARNNPRALTQLNTDHMSVLKVKDEESTNLSIHKTPSTVKATRVKQPKRKVNKRIEQRRYFLEIGKLISLELTLEQHGIALDAVTLDRLGGAS